MLDISQADLDLLHRTGQFGDGDTALIEAATTTAPRLGIRVFFLGPGHQLGNGQLLISHLVVSLILTFVDLSEDHAFAQSPRTDF